MTWHDQGVLVLEIVIAAVVVFGVAAVATGHGGSITPFAPDWPGRRLPEDRALRAADVTHARFSLAIRGYRMEEVDAALDRLAFEIARRDARIEQLTGRPYEAPQADAELQPAAAPQDAEERSDEHPVETTEANVASESSDPADPNAAL